MSKTPESTFLDERHDFSLVLGGPTFQLLRRSRLEGDHLELLRRRIIVITLFVWLPVCLLSYFASPRDGASRLSFLRDIEVHARFLIALPVLIAGELLVHRRIRPVIRRFVERSIVIQEDMPRFENAIQSAIRLRNSVSIEVGLLLCAYFGGLLVWNSRFGFTTSTWYANPEGRWNLTSAGYWYVFVSIPVVQFILLRWYFRLFIWFRFLWQVSRMNLHLIPVHPDRCAGLAFLGKSSYAFGPVLFAQGAMLSGLVASRVLYRGESLLSFKLQIGGFIVFFVIAILGPLLMFTPKMADARRKGLADYGLLAQRYVAGFEEKWVIRDLSVREELLGSADIQSLADLGNSYSMVREMRPVPFGLDDITRLAAATAAPLLPLLLTIFSPEELLLRIIKVIF
jgi:hypothetical protein